MTSRGNTDPIGQPTRAFAPPRVRSLHSKPRATVAHMLSVRDLNRTLLRRQHLLERTSMPALAMVEHLLGLQAQDNVPPYLSLAARLDAFDPLELSDALERRDAVRVVTMRGTVHVHTADDALGLRPWVQPVLDRQIVSNQGIREARHLPAAEVVSTVRRILDDGALPVRRLGERLAEQYPDVPAAALILLARQSVPLVQVPPRGLWKRSGGVVYQPIEDFLGRPLAEVDPLELVRRYLRAFGPATPADMSTWSGVTGLRTVFEELRDELVELRCDDGRIRFDVPDAPRAVGDEPAPVRMLGGYDNVWLSHAERSVIGTPEARQKWMGANGGAGSVILVDGFIGGLWWWRKDAVELDLFDSLTRPQGEELDEEAQRIKALLSA